LFTQKCLAHEPEVDTTLMKKFPMERTFRNKEKTFSVGKNSDDPLYNCGALPSSESKYKYVIKTKNSFG
jgi:hypothetical protein